MSEKSSAHRYKVLKQFLDISDDRNTKPKPSSRKLQKLLKLSDGQFKELSTDVYDELRRRIDESRGEPDYLLPKSSFHPMRNQARQKLSSLPQNRFKDLVGDIAYEIERRQLHLEPEVEKEPEPEPEPKQEPVSEPSVSAPSSEIKRDPGYPRDDIDLNDIAHDKSVISDHDESNLSKGSSEMLNQSIGISSKTVVPTKATLTWSSDEEEKGDENDDDYDDDANDNNNGIDRSLDDGTLKQNGKSLDHLNGSLDHQATIDDLTKKLEDQTAEYEQLKLSLSKTQQQLDDTLDQNYKLSQQKEEWDAAKADYESKIQQLQNNTEYTDLMKEFEQVKSTNAALRLENQSLKNSANASTRDHSRSNSLGNNLSRELSVSGGAVHSPTEAKSKATGLNSQMNLILEKLTSLDAPPASEKKPSFVQLRNDVVKWQEKYEELKAGKYIKEFNTNLLSQNQLKGFVTSNGLIPIDLVGQLHSISETFLVYLDGKDFNSDVLFDKVSKLSIVANKIANHADGNHLNSNHLAVQLRDCASHMLTVTRYYTIYSTILPKVVVERALNDVAFATCELVGKCKISDKESIDTAALESVAAEQTGLKPPVSNVRSNNSSAYDLAPESNEDGTDVAVRPLRIANKLKNSGSNSNSASVDSFYSSKDLPVGRKFSAITSKFETSSDSLNNTITESNRTTPTKAANRSNIMDKVKQFESPPPELKSNGSSFLLDRSSLEIKKSPNLNRSVPAGAHTSMGSIGSTSSDVEKPSEYELAEAEANTDAAIEKSQAQESEVSRQAEVPVNVDADKKGESDKGIKKGTIVGSAAAGVAAIGAAATRSNSRGKGLFQSIRERFTEQPQSEDSTRSELKQEQEPVQKQELKQELEQEPARKQEFKQELEQEQKAVTEEPEGSDGARYTTTSTDDTLPSTAETTPSKESSSDVDVSPSKSFQSVRDRLTDRVPSVSASESTVRNDDYEHPYENQSQPQASSTTDNSPVSKRIPEENSEALDTLNGTSKKTVMISDAKPEEIHSKAAQEEEYDDEDASSVEDAKTAKARERQEYRKSMAAATFNVDLFDIDDPDNTLTQVLLYLEHQTVEVINTIQILLTAIKKPNATRGDLREKSKAITEVIKQMTEATNTSMNQTRNAQLKEHGSWVVKSLEDCHHRMSVLCKPSNDKKDSEFADRSFKQRLAGISFDIAKCTKELVKTVEEASLKEDIANLDARLSLGDDLT